MLTVQTDTPLPGFNDLEAPTSPTAALPSPDAALSSPTIERVRHHLIPARPSTCIRAPCLKRNITAPVSEHRAATAAENRGSDGTAVLTSFAAPRSQSFAHPRRQVHFDDAPPEQFPAYSGYNYDRRPIECTQGGSEFDMSLPPRCTSYHLGDDDTADDAESWSDTNGDLASFNDSTLDGWTCIKNGNSLESLSHQPSQQSGLTSAGKSVHASLWGLMQTQSEDGSSQAHHFKSPKSISAASDQVKSQVGLPVHGFRSFGGLSNSLAASQNLAKDDDSSSNRAELERGNTEPTRAGPKIASPDATPMPSPSIHKTVNFAGPSGFFGAIESVSARVQSDGLPMSRDRSRIPVNQAVAPLVSVEPLASEESLRQLDSNNLVSLNAATSALSLRQSSDQNESERFSMRGEHPNDGGETSLSIPDLSLPSLPKAGWNSVTGSLSSPLSSRCSSVDPWSCLSSDGNGDGADSPSNEASWNSSSCTSPDLSPSELSPDCLGPGKVGSSTSNPSWSHEKTPGIPTPDLARGSDSENERNDPTDDAGDISKFSSSLETVHGASQLVAQHSTAFSALVDDVWTSEASTPDTSRRPSIHKGELEASQLAARLKSRKATLGSDALEIGDGQLRKIRPRSSSRDASTLKKTKSNKCRACRINREREKVAVSSSLATGMDASHSISPTTQTVELLQGAGTLMVPAGSSPKQAPESRLFPRSRSRSGSRTRHMAGSLSRERSNERLGLRSPHTDRSVERGESEAETPGWLDSPSASAAEDTSVVLDTELSETALVCTCEKKKERDALRRKMRKERELERERDREWERDQARGRQRRLFGDSFDDSSNSCLSALDGF